MTVLDRVAKTKGAFAFEKVQVPQRASRFFFPLSLFFVSPHRSRLMTVGLTTKKEKKNTSLPWEGDGKRFAKQKPFHFGTFFPPRQVIRCPHLRDNEATVRLIVNTLHGLLNGLPCQASNTGLSNPPSSIYSPSFKFSVDH